MMAALNLPVGIITVESEQMKTHEGGLELTGDCWTPLSIKSLSVSFNLQQQRD